MIDESQTVREAAQPVVTMLRECDRSDHCHRLAEYAAGNATIQDINREDLLYPFRCHRDDGLVLRVEGPAQQNWVQYGPGDLFYWLTEDNRTLKNAIETKDMWYAAQGRVIDVQPRFIEDTPYGDDR
jgi:hypothetical protein